MNNTQFSLANRKQLADLLNDDYGGLRHKAKDRYRTEVQALHALYVKDLAEKKGAVEVQSHIVEAKKHLTDLEAALSKAGFEIDNSGDWSLNSNSPNSLQESIDKRIEKELGPKSAIDARFDSARLAMMTVASLEDADKLLKSVSEMK